MKRRRRKKNVGTGATVLVTLGAAAGTAAIVATYLTMQKSEALQACRMIGGIGGVR